MIRYTESTRSFVLSGKGYSYVMHIDGEGRLLHLYWGSELPDTDLNYLLPGYHATASFDRLPHVLPHECPTQEGAYFGLNAISCVNPEGDCEVSLRYTGHEILSGKPAIPGLPASYAEADDGAETLVITLADPLTKLAVKLYYTVNPLYGVLARSVRIANNGESTVTLTNVMSASVPVDGCDYDFIHLKGAWARERAIERHHLNGAENRIASRRGASGHEENPFIALAEPAATENSGRVWAMELVYSGSFTAACDVNNYRSTRMMIGLCPDVFSWKLEKGEEFCSPEALLVCSENGLNGMSRQLHRFIRTRIVRGVWRDRPRPILVNNWEGTYFDFTEEKLLAIASRAKEIGIELFVLDDGWFGKRDNDDCSLGDWVVNTRKLPHGIRGLSDRIHDMGLMFGLWFEPEMVSPDSDLYRAHPDWCLHVTGRERSLSRNQSILDLSRLEVQDYIIDNLSRVLERDGIDYVKWDMNRNMSEAYNETLPADRRRKTMHRYMLGLYRVMETLVTRFPNVLFEGCSGGGGRFDAGMLHYMPQIWTSDDTDAVERLFIQYGTSLAYPPSAMGAHVSAVPNHQVGRVTSMQMRGDVALSGNFGYELDLAKLSDADIETAKKHVSLVKKIRSTLQKGDFLRLESPYDGNFCAWEFISEDRREVLFMGYTILRRANAITKRWHLTGLEPMAMYRETTSGMVFSGSALMNAGLIFPEGETDFTSVLAHFERLG